MTTRSTARNTSTANYSIFIIFSGLLLAPPAIALNVTSGVMLKTIDPEALQQTVGMAVNDFFDAEAASTRLFNDLQNDVLLGPPPLSTNTFAFAVNSPTLDIPNRTTSPSDFSYDPSNLAGTATGFIGLGGVMRFDLSQNRFFLLGDWRIEYDESRKDNGGSGWIMRNLYQIPSITFDIMNENLVAGPDSFFLSGDLGWSPEFIDGFSLPDSITHQVVADIALCAQDDEALAANSAKQIPCVFPTIKAGGQSGTISIGAAQPFALEVDLNLATETSHPNADYFAAFVFEGQLYWLNQQFEWTTTPSPAYQGPLVNFQSIALPNPPLAFPAGTTVPVYFGVDTTQNGSFDEPHRFSVVNVQIN